MAVLILSSGKTRPVKPKKGVSFSLKELQGYVGGYIETIKFRDGRILVVNEEGIIRAVGGYIDTIKFRDGRILVVNEEGIIRAMPFNRLASIQLRKYSNVIDTIVGDALLCECYEIE